MPQQPKFSIEFKSLNNFERGPPKEHSCEVWLKYCHVVKEMLTTDDGHKVIRIEPLALGDLKKGP